MVVGRLIVCHSFAKFLVLLFAISTRTTGLGGNDAKGKCGNAVQMTYTVVQPSMEIWHQPPPIVLLHGILDSKKSWMFIAPNLADLTGRKVYALDMRNHGESPWEEEFDVEVLAQDLDCFLQANGIRKAVLVGHSLGAKAIMSLVLQKPQKAEKVVFEDMILSNLEFKQFLIIGHLLQTIRAAQNSVPNVADEATAKKLIGSAAVSLFVPGGDTNGVFMKNAEAALGTLPIERVRDGRYMWQANLDVLERAIATPGHFDHKSLKGTYYGDALFLYGTESFVNVSSDSATIRKHFPCAKMIAIDGGSHLLHQLNPERFLMDVVNFINAPPSTNVGHQLQFRF